jgi:predicted MFS family arabinose efflux permease
LGNWNIAPVNISLQNSISKAGLLLSLFALVIAVAGPFMTLMMSAMDRKKFMLTNLLLFQTFHLAFSILCYTLNNSL